MQNSWLFFSNLGLYGGYSFISAAESYPTFSYSSERWLGLSLFVDDAPNHSGPIYVPGNLALGLALVPLPHMTGGFLFWLMKRRNTDPTITFTKSEWGQELNYRKWYCFHKNCIACDIAKGNVQDTQAIPICKAGTRSVILERVAPIMSRKQWTGCQHYPSFPVFTLAAAFVPLLNNLSFKLLAIPIEDTTEKIMKERHESVQSHCRVQRIEECNILHLTKKTNRSFRDVVEPSTGVRFPTDLVSTQCGRGNTSPTSQVLVGVGSRSTIIAKVKPVKVYAFGLYVHLDCVCNKLRQKYSNVPPEELRNRQDFFEDLLRQDMWMTVRLVVHLKGLKLGMVRNVFECALRKRLIKIKGAADDDGLNAFCDYFSKDISISPGTTIDFHQSPGGHLRTEIDGKELGTIYSRDLCRAFFDMYVGEGPVSLKAKQDIGENIGCVLRKC